MLAMCNIGLLKNNTVLTTKFNPSSFNEQP